MLLEIAVGDAFGRPFEFASREIIDQYGGDISKYHRRTKPGQFHPEDVDRIKDGQENWPIIGIYTDDTQMSIAMVEHLLSMTPITQVSYVREFIRVYKRDINEFGEYRKGYSRRISSGLSNSEHPFEFLSTVEPKTKGNGCVMRTVPLGMLPTPQQVIHASIVHASTTHASIEGVNATIAVSLSAHYYYHKIKEDYREWMEKQMGRYIFQDIISAYEGGELPCDAKQTASICMRMVLENDSMFDILRKSIATGGDVDSIAAVSLGLAALKGTKNDLPPDLYNNLENGTYGREYLRLLDKAMVQTFPVNEEKSEDVFKII